MNPILTTFNANQTCNSRTTTYINYSQAAKILLNRQGNTQSNEQQINTLAVRIRRKFTGHSPVLGKQGGKYVLTEELIPLLLKPEFKGKIRRDVLINSIRKASRVLESAKV